MCIKNTEFPANKESVPAGNDNQNAETSQQVTNNAETANNETAALSLADILAGAQCAPTEAEKAQQAEADEAQAKLMQLLECAHSNIVDLDKEYPAPLPVVEVYDTPLAVIGEITAVKAKPKTGKTTSAAIICAAALGGDKFTPKGTVADCKVIYDDTEQSINDAQRIGRLVRDFSGLSHEEFKERFNIVYHRETDTKERIEQLEALIAEQHPQLVVVDNIADTLNDFNDNIESKQLVERLTGIAGKYECAILTLQHENKHIEDNHSQGHLGYQTEKKAAILGKCSKDDHGIMSWSCTGTRHKEVPTWSFYYDKDGNIVNGDAIRQQHEEAKKQEKAQQKAKKAQELADGYWTVCKNILTHQGGFLHQARLTEQLAAAKGVSQPTATKYIKMWKEDGKLTLTDHIISLNSTTD